MQALLQPFAELANNFLALAKRRRFAVDSVALMQAAGWWCGLLNWQCSANSVNFGPPLFGTCQP